MSQSYLNIKVVSLLFPLLMSWSNSLNIQNEIHNEVHKVDVDILDNSVYVEIPVLNINVYVMGREDIIQDVSLAIGDNIEYLNEEFEGQIKFNFNELFVDPNQAYLPDLRNAFFNQTENPINPVVEPIEKSGSINVYIFDTYSHENENVALMGFTPILKFGLDKYYLNSPVFDRVLISYEALFDKSTLVHELGHFFGLKHPWEMDKHKKHFFGIKSKEDEDHNHMSYGSNVQKFTPKQLDQMRKHVLKYRWYLLDSIERVKVKV